jgi:transcriptional regulator GlxA family with amidase domain
MIGCRPVRLRALFKQEFGVTIREYQTRQRVLRAARLLVTSAFKVDTVAHRAGFGGRRNFYDAFRRIVGHSPSTLRHWSSTDLDALEERLNVQSAPRKASKAFRSSEDNNR